MPHSFLVYNHNSMHSIHSNTLNIIKLIMDKLCVYIYEHINKSDMSQDSAYVVCGFLTEQTTIFGLMYSY